MLPLVRSLVFPVLPLALLSACRTTPVATTQPSTAEAVPTAVTPDGTAPETLAPTEAAPPPPETSATDFEGVWSTSFGIVRLERSGERLTGTYTYTPGATLTGTLEGRILRGTYHEPSNTTGGVSGRFAFELSEDGQSFRGSWAEGEGEVLEPRARRGQRWTGERVRGEPGRLWFVVLEENWEESLREPEYSFGAMLRSFFERVPAVGFRHRFIHDRADLERFCSELAGLVEPVVLYISSHGSPEGLSIGSDGISPEALGAALRSVGSLRLLHLGSCAVLAGDAPARIRAAAGKDFPISGFVESVDWAASAIVDFTYMQLVLEQGLEPAAAVAATRRMLSFANGPGDTGPLPGCDLVLSAPSNP